MSAALAAITFILGLLAPLDEAEAVTCTFKNWVWSSSYKICFYDCVGKQVTHVINSTETCPATIEK